MCVGGVTFLLSEQAKNPLTDSDELSTLIFYSDDQSSQAEPRLATKPLLSVRSSTHTHTHTSLKGLFPGLAVLISHLEDPFHQ